MMKEKRYIHTDLEVRELGSNGTFKGYITTFGGKGYPIYRDMNETFKKGAFSKTLEESGGNFPIYYEHRGEQIGWAEKTIEDNKGVFTESWLNIDNSALARSQWALMQKAMELKKAKMGLSIGFRSLNEKIKITPGEPKLRVITEAQLFEFSVTAQQANPKAFVADVRSIDDYLASLDKLSFEERSLLYERLELMLKADPPQEPERGLHSILESLQSANSTLNRG